ncbi:glycosyl hydrolase family 61-domain-containing protein [Xylaria palmicola]|nr:glycosyl hydrolase family 61-domain-containing protein [Xylaria palmicola]
MRSVQVALILAFAAEALAHGYIYSITADNTVYPGWDIFVDGLLTPTPARIAYGGGSTGPVIDLNSSAMACNSVHNPAPGAIAEVRAGSNVTFNWSRWLYSHKGPMTAYMAPYEGNVSDVNVNKLEFFKIGEDTIDDNGVWGTVRMLNQTGGAWTTIIPADIKPGNYIIRHEIIALHFALHTNPGFEWSPIGPQFYMTCFNFKVTGNGTATPKGVTFPGGYQKDEPGFKYDVFNNQTIVPYPPVGPALYKSTTSVQLTPKSRVVIGPTGRGNAVDAAYFGCQRMVLTAQALTTSGFDAIGG